MTAISRLLTAAALLAATTGIASATTITLDSYGTSAAPGAAANTALAYTNPGGVTTTYNIPTVSPWVGLPGSSWVSYNANTYPGGSVIAAKGTYTYTSSFAATASSIGSITVLADDTTDVYLNDVLITAAAPATNPGTCVSGAPTCTKATTYTLSGFQNGTNVLKFDVSQINGGATGLDFAGTVNTAPTPEPGSLILLGTGVLGAAGAIRRRFRS